MNVARLLRQKGSSVATIRPDATVTAALAELADKGIGALVVSTAGETVEGIVSERDIVRHLHEAGPSVLEGPVSAIMSSQVRTTSPADSMGTLMEEMTAHRIRHLPVVDGDRLVGIVSIGDVVKARVNELEDDRQALHDYITAR